MRLHCHCDLCVCVFPYSCPVPPGATITNLAPGDDSGTVYAGNAVAQAAQADALAGYTYLRALTPAQDLTSTFDIGGRTFGPGVYNFQSSAFISSTLTLDAGGISNSLFVFNVSGSAI